MSAAVTLPDDIWSLILSFLVRAPPTVEASWPECHQHDLTVVMRVSSKFRRLAAPLLYTSVTLQILSPIFVGAHPWVPVKRSPTKREMLFLVRTLRLVGTTPRSALQLPFPAFPSSSFLADLLPNLETVIFQQRFDDDDDRGELGADMASWTLAAYSRLITSHPDTLRNVCVHYPDGQSNLPSHIVGHDQSLSNLTITHHPTCSQIQQWWSGLLTPEYVRGSRNRVMIADGRWRGDLDEWVMIWIMRTVRGARTPEQEGEGTRFEVIAGEEWPLARVEDTILRGFGDEWRDRQDVSAQDEEILREGIGEAWKGFVTVGVTKDVRECDGCGVRII